MYQFRNDVKNVLFANFLLLENSYTNCNNRKVSNYSFAQVDNCKIILKLKPTDNFEQLFCQYSFVKEFQIQSVIRENLRKTLSYNKSCLYTVGEIET